jgi:hypothetical protein
MKNKELVSTLASIIFLGVVIFIIFFQPFWNKKPINTDSEKQTSIKCSRNKPYDIPPELERARSLRQQRLSEFGIDLDFSFYNCIHIMYADLSEQDADGLFVFDKNSSIDDLRIYVDKAYKEKDDILTAILLDHEFVHVSQFVNEIEDIKKTSCIDSETEAFLHQVNFLRTLNEEEIMSLVQRLLYYKDGGYRGSASKSTFAMLDTLISFNGLAKKSCQYVSKEAYSDCYFTMQSSLVEKMIRDSESYQKQCGL